jgi:hypothetical protein
VSDATPRAPRRNPFDELLARLPLRIGEVLVEHDGAGGFVLRHRADAQRNDLARHLDAEAANEIARYDDDGRYRPLKTAPNLRRGWLLALADRAQVRRALDLFYPGRIAAFEAWCHDRLRTTSFRETLARQTGMYRVAAKIRDDQANQLIADFCRSDCGCLRTIFWRRDASGALPSTLLPPAKFDPSHDQTGRNEPTLPLLCQEICNLLVAAARNTAKVRNSDARS